MNLTPLWKKCVAESAFDAKVKETLAGFDPDALREQLAEAQKKLDDAENAQLSETEKLQKELAQLRAEREDIDAKFRTLARRGRIERIARDHGCDDPEYLDFLAGKRSVDLDDDNAVSAMMEELKKTHPFAFFSHLQSGGGSGSAEALDPGEERAGSDPVSRIGVLMQSIGKVPFQE